MLQNLTLLWERELKNILHSSPYPSSSQKKKNMKAKYSTVVAFPKTRGPYLPISVVSWKKKMEIFIYIK